jgi:hypothetical protein
MSQWSYFFPTAFSQNAGSAGGIKPGTMIPDNPRWQAGTGNDNIFLVEKRSTGEVWDVWMARQPAYNAITLTNIWAGFFWKSPQHVAGGACYTNTIFKNATTQSFRGMGIDKRALITTGEEVQAAIESKIPISHALEVTIANTWYTDSLKTAVAGVDWLPPATRCEFQTDQAKTRPGYDPDKTHLTLEGLRVALKLTPAERSAWLDRRIGVTGAFREFCRVVLDALCDYGMIVGETGGYGMRSEFDGVLGPARPIYQKYGWNVDKPEAQEYCFEKLLQDHADRLYVVRPAK